jgi:hypothetical protein
MWQLAKRKFNESLISTNMKNIENHILRLAYDNW